MEGTASMEDGIRREGAVEPLTLKFEMISVDVSGSEDMHKPAYPPRYIFESLAKRVKRDGVALNSKAGAFTVMGAVA